MAGELTRLEMQTEVLDNLTQSGVMTTANNVTLATMANRWINRAQNRIARMHNLIWREQTSATVASQKAYSFDSSMRSIISLRLEDGMDSRKLTLVMPSKFDLYYPKPDEHTEGASCIYVPFENTNTFELFPIPDTAYVLRLRGSFWPTSLTTDTSTSDYTYLDDVIIAYATMYGYQWLQEMNDAKFWKAVGNDELKAQINAELSKFPDWVMKSEGFSAGDEVFIGEYYNDPFVRSNPNGYLD
jgi:hypothetical protein